MGQRRSLTEQLDSSCCWAWKDASDPDSRYRRRRESFSKRRKEERRGEETGNPAPEKERLNACSRRDGGDDEGRWVGGGA